MPLTLPLSNMSERHSGLTLEVAAYFLQAAHVCFDRHHSSPSEFLLREGDQTSSAEVEWDATESRTRAAFANEIDTTEAGAYACVLAATELMKGLVAVRRAETGTGADYYVGPPNQVGEDLEDAFRLEVSGTDRGGVKYIEHRLREKVQQAKGGKSSLPAIAGVVGFEAKLIMLQMVDEIL